MAQHDTRDTENAERFPQSARKPDRLSKGTDEGFLRATHTSVVVWLQHVLPLCLCPTVLQSVPVQYRFHFAAIQSTGGTLLWIITSIIYFTAFVHSFARMIRIIRNQHFVFFRKGNEKFN